MKASRRADLHCHTSASDGTGSLDDLIEAAESRHVSIVAVADHNTVESAREAQAYMRRFEESGSCGVRVVPGIEISSEIDLGSGVDVVHVIGLGIDPGEKNLVDLCGNLRKRRIEELCEHFDFVKSRGCELCGAVEEKALREAFWNEGYLTGTLLDAYRLDSDDSAYHALLNASERVGFKTQSYVPAGDAIAAIHASGGISVLAHPYRDEVARSSIARERVVRRIELLGSYGLDAVEAYYRTSPVDECEWLEGLAKARGLLVSAGSDHHDSFPGMRRFRMGVTAADGNNYGHRASVLDAIGL